MIGIVYAAGYGVGVVTPLIRRGAAWMKPLEITNVAVGFLTLVVILALFSPLADPAGLSVGDQVKRLEAGKVAPDKFDYGFLAARSGKVGERALEALIRSQDATIAKRAADAKIDASDTRFPITPAEMAARTEITMVEPGVSLPSGFASPLPEAEALQNCTRAAGGCKARLFDIDADGRDELLVAHQFALLTFALGADGKWTFQGSYVPTRCSGSGSGSGDMREVLAKEEFRAAPVRWPNLTSGKATRWTFSPDTNCPATAPPR